MKKLLLTIVMIFSGVLLHAQENYKFMRDVSVVNYTVDYSAFKIDKINAENFVPMKLNMDFDKFLSASTDILMENAREHMNPLLLTLNNNIKSDIELKVEFLKADLDGESTMSCTLLYKPTGLKISVFDLDSEGGDDDTFQDGYMKSVRKSGKKLGKQLFDIYEKGNPDIAIKMHKILSGGVDINELASNLDSYKGFLLLEGNNVFVYSSKSIADPDLVYDKVGAEVIKSQLKKDGFWNVVDDISKAHVAINYMVDTSSSDISILYFRVKGNKKPFVVSRRNSSESVEQNKKIALKMYEKVIVPLQQKIKGGKVDSKFLKYFIVE
ncbi:MAG: hypothetical protein K6A78_10520 [Prevotella sp.]|nr:hypothetical protein [Prevotella sp.]